MAKRNETASVLDVTCDMGEGAKAVTPASTNGESGGAKWLRPSKLETGEHEFRVVPSKTPGAWPFKERWRHVYQDESGEWVAYTCPAKHAGKPCPDCARAKQLIDAGEASGDKATKELGYKIRHKRELVVPVIKRGAESEGVQLLPLSAPTGRKAAGKTQYERVMAAASHKHGGDIVNPRKGRDISVTKSGAKMDTNYHWTVDVKDTPLAPTDAEMLALIESQPDMGAIWEADLAAGITKAAELQAADREFAQPSARKSAPVGRPAMPTADDDLHAQFE